MYYNTLKPLCPKPTYTPFTSQCINAEFNVKSPNTISPFAPIAFGKFTFLAPHTDSPLLLRK